MSDDRPAPAARTQTQPRPLAVDELKRAWHAIADGQFRASASVRSELPPTCAPPVSRWSPAEGERTIAIVGCAGSVGASTLSLALGVAAPGPARVVECCSMTSSGLAAASTAELGEHPAGWRQGRRDGVLLERVGQQLAGIDEVPSPTHAEHHAQLTVLDVGWDVGQLLVAGGWLAGAVEAADRVVVATTATMPGMRRLAVVMDLLSSRWEPDQLVVAVRGPRRRRWPRGVEVAGGPVVRRALAAIPLVVIPEDRELGVTGLDTRPLPAPLLAAARHLLELAAGPVAAPTTGTRDKEVGTWTR